MSETKNVKLLKEVSNLLEEISVKKLVNSQKENLQICRSSSFSAKQIYLWIKLEETGNVRKKKKVSNVWERNIDKQFFEKKLKHLCERENIFKKSEICCSFLIKNFSDEDFKTGSLHYCLIAGVWLGFGGSGCLHQRLWEESSEPRLIVDWKTGSAAEPTLHSVQAQSRHAQKQRW